MIVTILYRQEGSPYASGSGFRDVPSNQYYSAAVAWASENGIVNGYIDGSFRPNDAVSMQEMLTIFYRYAQKKSMKTDIKEIMYDIMKIIYQMNKKMHVVSVF